MRIGIPAVLASLMVVPPTALAGLDPNKPTWWDWTGPNPGQSS
jgi:hypothetical protein